MNTDTLESKGQQVEHEKCVFIQLRKVNQSPKQPWEEQEKMNL